MIRRPKRPSITATLGATIASMVAWPAAATALDYDAPPIAYSATPAHDEVAKLQQALARGEASLACDPHFGYLPALLARFDISPASQVLVFSKTSLQKDRICPETPRAIYFNDDIYVGSVPDGDAIEVAATDPRQGTMFYVFPQRAAAHPEFVRKTGECLICHDAQTFTGGVPGLFMRSVYPEPTGLPIFKAGTFVTDQQSPFRDRWGGWYVTGTHGSLRHLGNLVTDESVAPEQVDRERGANLSSIDGRIDASSYLGHGSDLVALLVLAHQTQMHNHITSVGFETRAALLAEQEMNQALARPAGFRSPSTQHRIEHACDALVHYLLCCGEARLPDPVVGTSGFATHFAERGPHDGRGRSLRELDLRRRLLRYPCSYLIYSDAFDQLPAPAKQCIYQRLWEILSDQDRSPDFAHLDADDRRAIRDILSATKPDLPDCWR